MKHWFELFIEQIKQAGWLQWVSTVFGIAEVLLARANSIWLYPTGLISIVVSVYLLIDVRLYAEAVLSMYYFVMSIYGWWHWVKRRNETAVEISYSTRREWKITLAIVFGGWLIFYQAITYFGRMGYITPSDVPLWDSWVSSTAWAGMWLLARRKVENWLLLNVSNLFAVPLLFHKQLPLYALLTIFLFTVACFGYADWKKKADV